MASEVPPTSELEKQEEPTKQEIAKAADEVIEVAEAAKDEAKNATPSELAELKETMTSVNVKLESVISQLAAMKQFPSMSTVDSTGVTEVEAELPEKIVEPKKPHWLTKLPKGF